jgi:predicted hotdog family 3-hydroxylacyl-ACP dehydratase
MINPMEDISSLIPQRPPFVMVDRLIYAGENLARSGFKVRDDNIFLKDGELLEAALVENIAQTVAAREGFEANERNRPVSIGYIGAVNNLFVYSLPRLHDELETEIEIENQVFNVTLISGTIRCNGVVMAHCKMKIFITQTQ